MKTMRVQIEELLLLKASIIEEQRGHPTLNEVNEIEIKISALISEDASLHQGQLLWEISKLALNAYAHCGVSREEIAANPASAPLIGLLLLFLGRYCDGLRSQKSKRTMALWRMVANAFFLVQTTRGRPGPYSSAQKAELKTAYAGARNLAVSAGKNEADAHRLGLFAAYRSARLEATTSGSRFKEHRARIQRILKYAGLSGRRTGAVRRLSKRRQP